MPYELSCLQRALILAFLFSIPFQICYVVTRLLFFRTVQNKATDRRPPTLPYCVPILGNALSYVSDPLKFVTGRGTGAQLDPIRMKLFTKEIVLLRGPENIDRLWRQSKQSSVSAIAYIAVRNLFGMNERSARRHLLDDSGINVRPHPGSNVLPHNRIEYNSHKEQHRLLMGTGMVPLFDRFQRDLSARLSRLEVEDRWIEKPDLPEFMALELMPTILTAACGPELVRLSPNFPRLFWEYNERTSSLLKGLPRWLTPKAHALRDSLLVSIKAWQRYASEKTAELKVQAGDEEVPFWGERYFRDRREMLLAMDDYDEDATASDMLGTMWAFNMNIIVATIWATLDVFQDPELLARVRNEVDLCRSDSSESGLSIDQLLQQPVIQAVFAETLRLRVHVFITWYSYRETLGIGGGWSIPPKTTVMAPTSPAHFNEEVWNTGHDGRHPVDTFWAGRFLIVPGDDERFGPMKTPRGLARRRDSLKDGTYFAEDSIDNRSWFPFGGGVRMCPGRPFAKRVMLLALARMTRDFDIEVTADATQLKMGMASFGQGSQMPKGKVPFRIRRRRSSGGGGPDVSQRMHK